MALPYAHLWTLTDTTITEFRQYTDAAAFRAATSPATTSTQQR